MAVSGTRGADSGATSVGDRRRVQMPGLNRRARAPSWRRVAPDGYASATSEVLVAVDGEANLGAAPAGGANRQGGADQLGALPHGDEAEAAGCAPLPGSKPTPSSLHGRRHARAVARQPHADAAGAAVTGDVGERLLHDAVEVQRLLVREQAVDRGRREAQRQAVALRELAGVRAQRLLEPERRAARRDDSRGRCARPTR